MDLSGFEAPGFGNDYFGQPKSVAPAPAKKKKNLLESFLPSIGGIGGSVGGAALGTAILPGAGTLVGALLGGALGGGGGKVVENAAEHQSLGSGVAGQAALNGVLGAGPIRLARFGVDAARGARFVAPEVASTAPSVISGTSRAINIGRGIGGIAAGTEAKAGTAAALDSIASIKAQNDLAKQYISHLADEASKQGVLLGEGGNAGMLVRPGKIPSFASEGIEPKQVPGLPQNPNVTNFNSLKSIKTASGITPLASTSYNANNFLTRAGIKATGPGIISRTRSGIANKGAQFESRAAGVGVGETLSKANGPLGAKASEDMLNLLKQEGIKPGTPEFRQKQVEDLLSQRGRQINEHIATNNVALNTPAKKSIASGFMNSIESKASVDDPTRKAAQNLISNFNKQVSDSKGLVDFRRSLDEAINFNKNPDTAETVAKQVAAKTFRKVLKQQENKLIPGVKPLNESFSNLTNLNKGLLDASKKVSNQSEAGGGSVTGMLFKNDTVQGAKSRLGSGLQKAAPKSVNPFGPKAVGTRVLPAGLISNSDFSSQPGQPQTAAGFGLDLGGSTGAPQNTQQAPQSPYPLENALYDAERDPKNADYYMKLYDFANPKQGTETPGYSKPSAQVHSQAVTALDSIGKLEQLLGQNPNLPKSASTPGQGLPIVGSFEQKALGTNTYRALTHNILNSVARINTGANMPASEERFYEQNYLPQPGDSPQDIASKLETLRQFFNPIASYPGSTDSSTSNLTDAILSQIGQ